MQLLADRLVEVGVMDEISDETVRRTLKNICSNRGKSSTGAFPTVGSDFVWRMEDVLDLYAEPADPDSPRICFDECPNPMLDHVREPLLPQPGKSKRVDYAYEREGTCNLFLLLEPTLGWRHVEVAKRCTKQDFAATMKELVEVHFLKERQRSGLY